MKNAKNDYLFDYLLTFKNPLDKKFRWEVNMAFKQGRINDEQRKELLLITPKGLYELSVVVRNGIKTDEKQLGKFYLKRAKSYNNQKRKKQTEFINNFSK